MLVNAANDHERRCLQPPPAVSIKNRDEAIDRNYRAKADGWVIAPLEFV